LRSSGRFFNRGRGYRPYFDALPETTKSQPKFLEFFQPEAEEHLQIVSDCLLSLEAKIIVLKKSTNSSRAIYTQ